MKKVDRKWMSRGAASRIQRAACLAKGGTVPPGSFATRAMSAAYTNEPLARPGLSNKATPVVQQSDSPTDDEEEGACATALIAGVGLFAAGAAGVMIYKAAKEREERKSCCERFCNIL